MVSQSRIRLTVPVGGISVSARAESALATEFQRARLLPRFARALAISPRGVDFEVRNADQIGGWHLQLRAVPAHPGTDRQQLAQGLGGPLGLRPSAVGIRLSPRMPAGFDRRRPHSL
jgi:hypothetical protein